jgi:hypothetical protein
MPMPDGALAIVSDGTNRIKRARREIPAVCQTGGQPAIRASRIDHEVSSTAAVGYR